MSVPASRAANTRLLMAALIAAVRTARFEGDELNGMGTPRMRAQIDNSLRLAEALCKAAEARYGHWFEADQDKGKGPR